MKKVLHILAVALIAAMMLSLIACTSGSTTTTDTSASTDTADTAATTDTAATDSTESTDTAETGSDAAINPDRNGDGVVEVSLLVKKLSSTFWTDMEQGCKDACEELGWVMRPTLCPVTPDSNEEQIQLIEQDLLDPPDLYILCPANSDGIIPVVEKINEAGVPIINVNTRIGSGPEYLAFCGVDCYELATLVGESLSEAMNYEGNVVILEGVSGSQTAIDYKAGGVDVFNKYEGITILDSQIANYQRQDAITVTQNLLQKYDDIDAIYACNLEMAMGALVACEQAGREGILIGTVNMSSEGMQALADGRLYMIVDDNPYNVAYTAVHSFDEYCNGETVLDGGDITCPGTVVTIDNEASTFYYEKYGITPPQQ